MMRAVLEQALDRLEAAFNAMHPGAYTEDELHGLAQGLWFGAEEVRRALDVAPRFRELDEIEWSRPGLTPDQVADYRAAILRERT